MEDKMLAEINAKIAEAKDKALIAKSINPPSISTENWGASEQVDAGDILIPKIFHQQAMSKLVAEGKARPGDFCDSLTGEVIGKKEEALEVIIFGSFKTMIISRFDPRSQKFELENVVRITPHNATQYAAKPFQSEDEQGVLWRYNMQYNYYCLLPSNLTGLPYVLSLSSTKTKVAKRINTFFFKLRKPSASVVIELLSVAEKNDRGAWFGLDVAQGRDTTEVEFATARDWYLKSQAQNIAGPGHDDEDVPF